MLELGLIVVAVVAVLVWLLRPRGEDPPPVTLEGGSSHLREPPARRR